MATPALASGTTDVLATYHTTRIQRLGVREALSHDNATFIAQLLVDPSSPYSEVIDQPVLTNDLDWAHAVDALPSKDQTIALQSLRIALGLTRARPGIDVMPQAGYRDRFVAASATKGRVDPDIFWHALDLTGQAHSTKAAAYAVGLQILRDQVTAMPDAARRDAVGVDKNVLDRMIAARALEYVPPGDLRYLSLLVQHRLVHRIVDEASTLPTAYRIARIAAAYRDIQGYVSGPPCTRDARPRAPYAGDATAADPRPLCFVAATDRAVHRWYLAEVKRQAGRVSAESHAGPLARLQSMLAPVLVLLDIAALVEVGEMLIADDMMAEGSLTRAEADVATERVSRLTCPIDG